MQIKMPRQSEGGTLIGATLFYIDFCFPQGARYNSLGGSVIVILKRYDLPEEDRRLAQLVENREMLMSKRKSRLPKTALHAMQQAIIAKMELAKSRALEAKRKMRRLDKKLQNIIDEADVTMPLVANLKPNYFENLDGIWTSISDQVTVLDEDLRVLNLNVNSTAGSTSTNTVTISGAYINDGFQNLEEPIFKDYWRRFEQFASRPALKDEVVQLFRDFGFDVPQAPGEKSPLEQFEIAHTSFLNPVTEDNPVSTSLLPLRECIDTVVASLIRMRPHQEPAQGHRNKIISIGIQLKKTSFPQTIVEELADQWHSLHDDLSGSKKKNITRDDWLARLNRGTSFLHGLLNGLDPHKLRR